MAKEKDTFTYQLKQGNEIVYIGITDDPGRREDQHRRKGKKFDKMNHSKTPMTKEQAKKKEAKQLDAYREKYGRNPKYNKDSDG